MVIKLNRIYWAIALVLLTVETLIATYLKTGFIRYTFGDFLAVILIYCFVKSFLEVNSLKLGIFVLILAFLIEFLQLINILELLHLQNHKLITIIVGNTFEMADLVAYTLGIITVLIIDIKFHKQ